MQIIHNGNNLCGLQAELEIQWKLILNIHSNGKAHEV